MATQKNTPDSLKKICACGCGTFTRTDTATYVPGHDAKHVSALLDDARAIVAANGRISTGATRVLVDSIASPALQIKLRSAIERLGRKRPSSRKPKTEWVLSGTDAYKIGRWEYPVLVEVYVETPDLGPAELGEYLGSKRNTKRDGSGEWVELTGGELVGL